MRPSLPAPGARSPADAAAGPTPGSPAPRLVRAMFGRIARRYDLMNSLMTAGLDDGWRRAAVRAAKARPDGLALDAGTGTARLAETLAAAMPRGRVVGLDLTLPMLQAGQRWLWGRPTAERIALVAGDALALPFADGTFDCLTSAFTVRNLADLEAGFREQVRVLKSGGSLVCLELTWPTNRLLRRVFPTYFGRFVPLLGGLIAGDTDAYTYLPESVRTFPAPDRLAAIMVRAGLTSIRWRRLGFGTVALHVGEKSGSTDNGPRA